jgi:hypothetical protein
MLEPDFFSRYDQLAKLAESLSGVASQLAAATNSLHQVQSQLAQQQAAHVHMSRKETKISLSHAPAATRAARNVMPVAPHDATARATARATGREMGLRSSTQYVSGPRPCDVCSRAEGGIGVLVMTTSDNFDAEFGLQNHLDYMDSVPCMVVVTVDFKDKRPDADSERNRLDWIRNNSGSLQRWAERFENMSSGRTSILVEAINVHTCRSQDWTKYFHGTKKCLGPYNSWRNAMAYRVGFARLRAGCALYAVHVDSDIRLVADAKFGQHGEHGKHWVRLAIAALNTQPKVWALGPVDPAWRPRKRRPYGNASSTSTQALVVHLDRFEQMMPLTPHRKGHHIEELISMAAARIGFMQAFLPPVELGVFKKVIPQYVHNRMEAKALQAQNISLPRRSNASERRASVQQQQQQCILCFGQYG